MNPDEIIQLALVGIQSLVSLIAKVQANHQMSDAQLDAYINSTDQQTRDMVNKFLASMPAPQGSGSERYGSSRPDVMPSDEPPAPPAPPSQPDASTGSE